MGDVNITINGRSFKLGCDDGEEQHLVVLADHLDKHIDNLRQTVGKAGEEQLYLMAGLMVCDELWDARDLLIKAEELLQRRADTQSSPVTPPLKNEVTSKVSLSLDSAPGGALVQDSMGQQRPAASPAQVQPQKPVGKPT